MGEQGSPKEGAKRFGASDVDTVNTYAAKHTIAGWFIGLIYFGYTSTEAQHLPWWGYGLLGFVGMFVASIAIGGGVALLMAIITKATSNDPRTTPTFFAWGAFISPVLAFFAAKYVLRLVYSL